MAKRQRLWGSCVLLLATSFWVGETVRAIEAPPAAATPDDLLTAEERAWLAARDGTLVAGAEGNYRPYAFIDEDGEFSGLAGDYLELLEARLGVRFRTREYANFTALLDGARAREVDVVPFVIASESRESFLDFTPPVIEVPDRILVRRETSGSLDVDDLAGMRVGVVEGYVLEQELRQSHPSYRIIPQSDELTAVRALSLGEIDALIVDTGVAAHHIQREGIANLRVAGAIGRFAGQAFGTRSDLPILNEIIAKGLASITPEERRAIERRWLNLGGLDEAEVQRLWQRALALLAVLGMLALLVLLWIIALRRLVARRTADLEAELGERRRIEAINARLAGAIEQSAEFVFIVDAEHHVEYANSAFQRASGNATAPGRNFATLATPDHEGVIDAALDSLGPGDVWRGKVDLRTTTGDAVSTALTITSIAAESGVADGFVLTARDVTQEETLEARLRQSEKLSALGTLAGGIAHDFNNLLVPILVSTELLREDCDPAAYPNLNAIEQAGERARELVQQILTFSRNPEVGHEPLDLGREVEDTATLLRSMAPAALEIRTEEEPAQSVKGNRTELQQLLLNLGTNAIDAMDGRTGAVSIRTEPFTIATDSPEQERTQLPPGEYTRLSVSDTGSGMEAATRARMFDPYFTDKPQAKGTGLGLAIVHGIVTAHDGAITVDSTADEGTTIRVYLPTTDEAPLEPPEPEPAPAAPEAGRSQRILLVDDDELVLETISALLRSFSYDVTPENVPTAALERVKARPEGFDLLLTDFTMPGLNGVELAREVHQLRRDLPIVLMSGNTAALPEIPFPCLGKPVRSRDLASCIETMLGKR